MLLVVSCTQEVAPKNEDNGLVEAKLNVAFGKAINIAPENQDASIYYYYTLTPMWGALDSGFRYGEGTYTLGTGTYSSAPDGIITTSVTPGLWKIEVKGYLEQIGPDPTAKHVLYGVTKSYINKDENNIVVYVAPVTDESNEGGLSIRLEMEDLEENGAVTKVQYSIDGESTKHDLKQVDDDGQKLYVHDYITENNLELAAGFHTITFSLTNVYKGGVTRSFLIIPGQTVSITGSIYPSKFENESASINILSLGNGSLSISKVVTEGDNSASFEEGLAKGAKYTVTANGFSTINSVDGVYTVKSSSCEWYWGSEKNPVNTISSSSTTATLTTPSEPGVYALSCIAKCTIQFTLGDSNVEYTLIGEAVKQDILVE